MVLTRQFQDIWKDQCKAAEGIAKRLGTVQALDYLIGESSKCTPAVPQRSQSSRGNCTDGLESVRELFLDLAGLGDVGPVY